MPTPTTTRSHANSSLAADDRPNASVVGPGERRDAHVAEHAHAFAFVATAIELGDFRRHDPVHRSVRHFEHGHLEPQVARRGGGFEPDVAGAHDDQPLRCAEPGADAVDVGHRAQVMDAAQVLARHVEQAIATADAEQQVVVAEFLAVAESQALVRTVDRGHPHAEFHLDVMLLVEMRAAQQQSLTLEFAGQIFLRKRRPVVRQERFVADQHDAPGVPLASKRVDRLHRGVARADDHHRFVRHPATFSPLTRSYDAAKQQTRANPREDARAPGRWLCLRHASRTSHGQGKWAALHRGAPRSRNARDSGPGRVGTEPASTARGPRGGGGAAATVVSVSTQWGPRPAAGQ